MKTIISFGLAALLSLSAWGAPPPEPNADVHNALRALRDRLMAATNNRDVGGMVAELHPNVTITWQDATVSRGRDGVRAYLENKLKGPNPIVRAYHASINVDELTALFGSDTGVAYGSSVETFDLASGLKFTLHGRWSATMVRENGRWWLASVHASSNLFDNPLLSATKKSFTIGIVAAALAALLIGWFVGRRTARTAAA